MTIPSRRALTRGAQGVNVACAVGRGRVTSSRWWWSRSATDTEMADRVQGPTHPAEGIPQDVQANRPALSAFPSTSQAFYV